MVRVDELPDDPQLLKQLLSEQQREFIAHTNHIEEQLEQVKREAADQILALKQKHQADLLALLRRNYGPRSERFDPSQLLLFGVRIDALALDEKSIAEESGEPVRSRRVHRHGRRKLPDALERHRIEHDLPVDEKDCPCCHEPRARIGEEVSEQLEFVPASLFVLQHVRFKYACKRCEASGRSPQIATAVKTPQPIEKGLPGPGLLANVITSKLADHLPLYRLERIYARHGVEIARSTMCAWMQAAAELVRPLEDIMMERRLA